MSSALIDPHVKVRQDQREEMSQADDTGPQPQATTAPASPGSPAAVPVLPPQRLPWGLRPGLLRGAEALRYSDYRLLWMAQLLSSMGLWMDNLTRNWLLYDLTGSILLLGLLGAVRSGPLLLFGLIGGVLADRTDRRRVLLLAEIVSSTVHVVMAMLVVLGRLEAWHIFASAVIAGTVSSIKVSARQAFIPTLVPRASLLNAVTLSSAAINVARFIGPAVAGVLIAWLGPALTYTVQAVWFALAGLMAAGLPAAKMLASGRPRRSAYRSLVEGFAYIRAEPVILSVLVLVLVASVLAYPYQQLLPVFAKDILAGGPRLLGVMTTAAAVGSMLAIVILASAGDFRAKGYVLLAAVAAFGLSLAAFGFSRVAVLSLLLLAGVGAAGSIVRTLAQTLLHTATPDGLRGRVLSIYLLDRGLTPVGMLLVSTLAQFGGAPLAIAIMGSTCALLALIMAARMPALRRLS